jgi:tetratricopeptide (TPR) repeat protein
MVIQSTKVLSMIRLIIFLLFINLPVIAQDLYNFENSKKFAEYLSKSGQYELAAREYERLIFMNNQNDTLKTTLFAMYRRAGKYDEGINRARQLYSNLDSIPANSALEYSKLLLLKSDYKPVNEFLKSSQTIRQSDKVILTATSAILQDNYKQAKEILAVLKPEDHRMATDFQNLVNQSFKVKKKSPAVAGLMSAIVPGTGRFYAKDWKDGIVSMVFTGIMVIQSYRGFSQSGVKSTRGWIYGAVGFGFYLGNIHGSVVSAKNYNRKSYQGIRTKIDNLFNAYF